MNIRSKDRVRRTLAGGQTDRVPVNCGANAGIDRGLKRHYATSVRLSRDVRLDLFDAGMFRLRLAQECPYREPDAAELAPGMFRLSGDAAAHAASLRTREEAAARLGLPLRDPFDACLDIPFCCGRVEPWPEVAHVHRVDGDRHVVVTEEVEIRVDGAAGDWSVWTLDGARRIYPSDAPRYGYFHGDYAVFDREYGNRNADCFYTAAAGHYVREIVSMRECYFIHGPGYAKCFARFNALVGPQALPPKKLFGFIQTQHLWNRGSQARLLALAEKLRRQRIPCDVLIVDYEWGDGCDGAESFAWGSRNEWASTYRAPLAPAEMVARLRELGFEVMLIHHGEPGSADAATDPWFVKLKEKLDDGVAGTWQDTRRHAWQDHVIWLGLERMRPGTRPYFLGNNDLFQLDGWYRDKRRNGLADLGSRRYPCHWTGDCDLTWKEFKWQIEAITGARGALRGFSYLASDASGRNWKLQARWNQFCDFSAVSRSHTLKPWPTEEDPGLMGSEQFHRWFMEESVKGRTAEKDPALRPDYLDETPMDWSGSPEESIRKHRRLRYRLLPYIYSTAHEYYATGMPICRPMLLAFPEDPACNRNQWPCQYMFGEWLLVAPVYGDFERMDVYLPAGETWVDYWDGCAYAGGQTIRYDTRRIDKLPLFVRRGAILPLRPESDWIKPGDPDDPITLDVYPGQADSAFTLCEDDGVSTAYRRGAVARTTIRVGILRAGGVRIEIGAAEGGYDGQPTERAWRVRLHPRAGDPLGAVRVDGADAVCGGAEAGEVFLPRTNVRTARRVEVVPAGGRTRRL
jgi:hypothetical protein